MHDDLHNQAAGSAVGAAPPSVRNAQDLLQRDYERLRPIVGRVVGSRLRNAVGWVDEAVVDAAYNQAWHAVYLKLAEGEQVDDLNALLVTITHRRAIDDLRTQHWDRQANETLEDQGSFEQDLDGQLDDQVRLQHAFEAMREKLNPRERHAAVLCYVLGHSRPEAADQLGVSRKRMEKIMDGVSGKLAQLTPGLGSQQWCRERAGLIRSYALGLLDPEGERYAQASRHLEGCSACRRQVLVVRGLGAVVPPWPLLAVLKSSAVVGAGTAATGAGAPAGGAAPAASGSSGPWSTIAGNVRPATVVGAVAAAAVVAAVAAAAIVQPAFLGAGKHQASPTAAAPAHGGAAGAGGGGGSGAAGGSGGASGSGSSTTAAKPKTPKPRRTSTAGAPTSSSSAAAAPVLASVASGPVVPAAASASPDATAAPPTAAGGSDTGESGGASSSGNGAGGSSGSGSSGSGSSGTKKPDAKPSTKPDRPSRPRPDVPPATTPVAPPVVAPPVVTPPVAVAPVTPTPPTTVPVTPPVTTPVVTPPVDPPLTPPVDPPDSCTLRVDGVCVIP